MTMMVCSRRFFFVSSLCTFLLISSTFALPPGFVVEPLTRLSSITDITTLPAPINHTSSTILLVTSKRGQIYVLDDPDNNPEHAILAADFTDRLCRNGERGIGAAVAHPDFLNNGFIYVYYTYNQGNTTCAESSITGPVNRCSRFRMDTTRSYTLDTTTELVLFQTPPLTKRNHNAGDMVFGPAPDGYLYVSIGDAGTPQRERVSQNTSNLFGTIVRVTDTGNIPPDNPFATDGVRCRRTGAASAGNNGAAGCREIFAWGLRNPFKIALDPNVKETTRFYINDVGGATWEETSVAGTEYAGANYGYPLREGPCSGTGNGGNNVANCGPDPRFQEPFHFYQHRDRVELGGGCITGGAVIPNGYWPSTFDNMYFFADFVFGEIYYISPGGGCRECEPPTPAFQNHTFHEFERVTGMTFAPYKDSIALYFGSEKNLPNTFFRIIYVGGANVAPTARIESNKVISAVGESIQFSGEGSEDPENKPLSFTWEFGDNSTSNGETVTHTYAVKGVYTVVLTTDDGEGGVSEASITVTIGAPPSVTIESPVEGTKFSVGEVFTLRGKALDYNGNQLPASSLSWEVRQHHSTHWHPFLDATSGNEVVLFPAPSPEDLLAATNSHLEILLTATDSEGLPTTISQLVLPKTVWLEFDTEPSGIDIYLDSYRVETPARVLSWVDHPLHVVTSTDHDDSLVFLEWSDGGDADHLISVAENVDEDAQRYVAKFQSKSSLDLDSNQASSGSKPCLGFALSLFGLVLQTVIHLVFAKQVGSL